MNKTIIYIATFVLITSCNFFGGNSSSKKEKVIAKVYETKLYEEDFQRIFPKNISKKDSAVVARNLINSWAKQQLLLLKSKVNMPSENVELENLVIKYREDLFINSFKEALIKQKLDTIVTKEQIVSYYNENKESFKINEELLKFKYIRIEKNNKNKSQLRRLLVSNGKNDLYLLSEEEAQFSSSFLSDSIWIRYKDVLNKLPILKNHKKEKLIKPSNFIQKTDSLGLYYIYIKEVLSKNEIAPVRYISKIIKQMILHKRKLELVNTIEEVLVDDAIKNKQFEIY